MLTNDEQAEVDALAEFYRWVYDVEEWTRFRGAEWHSGAQHKSGVNKPSTFEERGVSIEYLPAQPFNWDQRKRRER